ncbi:MAG: sulfatase-like hydrolase/transferase [Thermoanaerobaculia bacterium]
MPALLLIVFSLAACRGGERPAADAPRFSDAPVILISIDTLRADHLAPFGGSGAVTPFIDALAAESVVFDNAWSHAPLTLPAHLSILTGRMPFEHGVRSNIGYAFDSTRFPSVPGRFRQAGRPSGAAISAYVLRGSTGIGEAFDFYDDAIENQPGAALGSLQRSGFRTAAIAADWIERNSEQSFFFMLHLFEPHAPYEAPERFAEGAATPYDGEIAAADAAVGEFLGRLKRAGIYDRAVIVLLSDHGEGLGDHGEDEHGIFLYREALRVPLMVKLPGGERRGARITDPVGVADVAPTLLALAGLEPVEAPHARSLFASPEPDRSVYAETMYPRIHLGWSELRSLTSGTLHYIEAPRAELYDYQSDPGERNNILADRRREAAVFRERLAEIPVELAVPKAVDPEEASRLQALGYLGGVSSKADGSDLPDPKDAIGAIAEMRTAFAMAAAGRTGEAIAMLRELVARHPGLTDARSRLGMLLEETGDLPAAERVIQEALRAEPRLAHEYALSLASIYIKQGRLDEAQKHAELALRLNPATAHQTLARIALERGDLEAARQHAERVRAHPTHRLVGSVLLAEVTGLSGRFGEALALVEQTRREIEATGGPPVESLDYLRGDYLARMDRLEEAIPAFRSEIANFPRNPRGYIGLATVSRVRGDLSGARAAIAEMVRVNPGAESRRIARFTLEQLDDPEGAARWK